MHPYAHACSRCVLKGCPPARVAADGATHVCGSPVNADLASTVRTYWGFHTSTPWYVTWDDFCGSQALTGACCAPRHHGWRTITTVLFCPAHCRCSMFKFVSNLRSVSNLLSTTFPLS